MSLSEETTDRDSRRGAGHTRTEAEMGRRSREPGHGESRGSHRTLAEGPGEDSPEGANLAYALFLDFWSPRL